jgi:hypothetical protein
MRGPYPPGVLQPLAEPTSFDWEHGRLIRGAIYRVICEFRDADGDLHSIGERWRFIGSRFSKFDDLLTVVVGDSCGEQREIPLFWTADGQERIIEDVDQYLDRETKGTGTKDRDKGDIKGDIGQA